MRSTTSAARGAVAPPGRLRAGRGQRLVAERVIVNREDPAGADPEDVVELAAELDSARLREPRDERPEDGPAVAGDELDGLGAEPSLEAPAQHVQHFLAASADRDVVNAAPRDPRIEPGLHLDVVAAPHRIHPADDDLQRPGVAVVRHPQARRQAATCSSFSSRSSPASSISPITLGSEIRL
jgi:hypothetical protein